MAVIAEDGDKGSSEDVLARMASKETSPHLGNGSQKPVDMEIETMAAVAHRGSIAAGMSTMLMLSILLSWIPALGTLVAGLVGGRIASGCGAALLASALPCLLIGTLLFFMAPLLASLPYIGALAIMGGLILSGVQIASLLVGALIGGLLSH